MAESKVSSLKRFWGLLKIYKLDLRQIYIFAVFNGLINLSLPLGIQAIVNYLQTGEVTNTWILMVAFVLVGILLAGILQVLQLRIVENIQQDLFTRSAFEFAFRIPKISFIHLDKVHMPELVNRFFDTLTIQKGLPKILIDFSLSSFQIIFGLLLLAIYSPVFIFLGIAMALVFWLVTRIIGPKGMATSLKESKYKYSLAHWLEEMARVNRVFKLNSRSDFHLEKTDHIVTDYLNSRESHFKVLLNQFKIFIGFKVFVAASLLVLGGVLVFREQMNIGQFVAAEIVIILIINSVEKVLRIIEAIYDVLTAFEKIGYITDLPLDNGKGTTELITEQGLEIKAESISFGFEKGTKKVLKDVSFEIKSNEKVILSGETGTGKTTLIQLLAGIHKVDDGLLRINGIPIENYLRDDLYSNVGVYFPPNQIFEGTIKENILLGRDIPEERLMEILDVLTLEDFVHNQVNGINTMVDSGGRRLPDSIIPKILFARILVGSPKLLLLEEPLHYVVDEEKKKIIEYVMDKKRNWTVLVISDFPYWAEYAERTISLT